MHEVLVNRLGGLSLPRKSVVRLSDRPDMTLDVYSGRKTTMQCNAITDTVQNIFMKLGTNINHHQTMCREQEPTLHLYFFTELFPLEIVTAQ